MVQVEKTIKIDENTYKSLNKLVGELRIKEKRPVSMNKAISTLLEEKKKHNIMDFAGSWDMSDEEAKKIKAELRKMWSTWKPKSL